MRVYTPSWWEGDGLRTDMLWNEAQERWVIESILTTFSGMLVSLSPLQQHDEARRFLLNLHELWGQYIPLHIISYLVRVLDTFHSHGLLRSRKGVVIPVRHSRPKYHVYVYHDREIHASFVCNSRREVDDQIDRQLLRYLIIKLS
jgi:hypothetical protein